MSKKNIVILGILIISLPVIIYLVQQTQIFKPKAVGEESTMTFFGTGVTDNGSNATTDRQNIGVRLTWGSGGGGNSHT